MSSCNRCLMDESAGDFQKLGDECNYCKDFTENSQKLLNQEFSLEGLIAEINKKTSRRQYGCVVGVSGGLDSSLALVRAHQLKLRPYAIHFDNGWNSELAQANIENLTRKLGIPLETHVVNWPTYRSAMEAFFDADVIDVELLHDNAMQRVVYDFALKLGVKHILSGVNFATEGFKIPPSWNHFKLDGRNIKGIVREGGGRLPSSYPVITPLRFGYYKLRGLKRVPFLNFFDYSRDGALQELVTDYNYKPYPQKHHESVFTRLYQSYILVEKFGSDKRKPHLSNLIMTGEISREQAMQLLSRAPMSKSDLESDVAYFIKKMGWSSEDLRRYMERPPRSHFEFPSDYLWLKKLKNIVNP